ncbi:type IV secretion protein Rhs [Psychrobacter sp. NPDC078631]|uniref:type IV secretion protein Rhs n=1 Tax=Psychrobacter sp. NPDC078631 TaxID=3390666 RepID=UPI003D068834
MSEPTLKRLFNRYLRSDTGKQQSRYLTAGEITLAYSVFGDSIKLDEVQLKTAWWVLKHYAVSPNGNIYFNSVDWITDFSKAPLNKQSWLIHELTHVWQLQQGLKVVRGAIINRKYDYVLETGKSFFKYGIEQQARMVQDYFVRRQRGQNCQEWEACIPFLTVQPIVKAENTDDPSAI